MYVRGDVEHVVKEEGQTIPIQRQRENTEGFSALEI